MVILATGPEFALAKEDDLADDVAGALVRAAAAGTTRVAKIENGAFKMHGRRLVARNALWEMLAQRGKAVVPVHWHCQGIAHEDTPQTGSCSLAQHCGRQSHAAGINGAQRNTTRRGRGRVARARRDQERGSHAGKREGARKKEKRNKKERRECVAHK